MVDLDDSIVEQDVISRFLGLLHDGQETNTVLEKTVELLTDYLKFEAVGIRVMDKEGNIPYQSYKGFSKGFIAKESNLCIRRDKCACIEISKGEYEPTLPIYTPYGSFVSNELQGLEAAKEGMSTGRFRGECVRSGWQTLGLFPIRFGHKYFGLIHVVDTEKNGLSTLRVKFIENIAAQLGLYMNGIEIRADREREFSSLVQRIMHDLKSPLTSTMAFAELISMEHAVKLGPEAMDMLARISRNADYMDELIKGLSGFAQTYDQESERATELDLGEFVPGIVSDIGVSEKNGYVVRFKGELPRVVYCPTSLRRVLTNLVSNAAKFSVHSEPPTVVISCQEKDTFYQIAVSDNGMGMESSDVDRIFEPFYRAESAKDIPGTGLGLSISRKLVEKHGGRMWAYSDKGKGSTFYFTLPKPA